jgi:hypothetical protein
MRIDIYPNFATEEEINFLNTWANLGVKNGWLDIGETAGFDRTHKRLSSRAYSSRYNYPNFVRILSDRIRKFIGIDSYGLILGHGRDGVVVSYTVDGGNVYKHKDQKSTEGLATLRCNILTQAPKEGGNLFIEGTHIPFNVGDLHCYLVSEHEHWTDDVKGDIPRIMWMFGAHVPAEDWNSGKIKVNNE